MCRGSVLIFSERHAISSSAFVVRASSNFVAEAVGSSETVMGQGWLQVYKKLCFNEATL